MSRIKVRDLKFEWMTTQDLCASGVIGTVYVIRLEAESRPLQDEMLKLAVCGAHVSGGNFKTYFGQYIGIEAAKGACQYHFDSEVRCHIEEGDTE